MNGEKEILLRANGREEIFSLRVKRRVGARNFVMRLLSDNEISVSAPFRASPAELEAFVEKHSEWIFEEIKNFKRKKTLRDYLSEKKYIWSGGVRLEVSVMEISGKAFYIEDLQRGEIVFASKNDAELKKLFLDYARVSIGRVLTAASAERGLRAEKYSVRNQRSRWASLSSTGMFSFNWRVALLEHKHQEYVVLHELAHQKFMDHSVSFWIHLSRLCPNAKQLDKEISKLGAELFRVE